jgi:hypothetical protein
MESPKSSDKAAKRTQRRETEIRRAISESDKALSLSIVGAESMKTK